MTIVLTSSGDAAFSARIESNAAARPSANREVFYNQETVDCESVRVLRILHHSVESEHS
jgi:hypothetical protein